MSYQRFSQTSQTTDATPTVILAVPIGESSAVRVDVEFAVSSSTFGNGASGSSYATFRRVSGGTGWSPIRVGTFA